jgi:hypothetical protein
MAKGSRFGAPGQKQSCSVHVQNPRTGVIGQKPGRVFSKPRVGTQGQPKAGGASGSGGKSVAFRRGQ